MPLIFLLNTIFSKMLFNQLAEVLNSLDRFQNIINIGSLFISVCSIFIVRKTWSDTYRPIITVRVAGNTSGNIATTLKLVVENSGNRPAKNIRLIVNSKQLDSALTKDKTNSGRKDIEHCFADETIIPMIANGQSMSNYFGCINIPYEKSSIAGKFYDYKYEKQSDWKPNVTLDIQIKYQNLNGKSYKDKMPILIASNQCFAGSFWNQPISNLINL